MPYQRPPIRTLLLAAAFALPVLTSCGGGSGASGDASPGAGSSPLPVQTDPLAPVLPDASGPGTPRPPQTVVPPPAFEDDTLGRLRARAFAALNALRVAAGSGALAQNVALDAAAQAHADYMTLNGPESQANLQVAGKPGFVGATPAARAAAYGPRVNEGIGLGIPVAFDCALTVQYVPEASTFLWPADDVGVGIGTYVDADGTTRQRCVYVTGTRKADEVQLPPAGELAAWPAPGMTLSLAGGWASKVAVSAYNQAFRSIASGEMAVARFDVVSPAGVATPLVVQPGIPGMAVGRIPVAVTAGTWTVRFEAAVRGAPVAKTWSFTVAP